MKKLVVTNLAYSVTDDVIRQLFEERGEVYSATVVFDHETGRSRGFGFVEMDDAGADDAISNLDGVELDGRNIRVSEAREDRGHHPHNHW